MHRAHAAGRAHSFQCSCGLAAQHSCYPAPLPLFPNFVHPRRMHGGRHGCGRARHPRSAPSSTIPNPPQPQQTLSPPQDMPRSRPYNPNQTPSPPQDTPRSCPYNPKQTPSPPQDMQHTRPNNPNQPHSPNQTPSPSQDMPRPHQPHPQPTPLSSTGGAAHPCLHHRRPRPAAAPVAAYQRMQAGCTWRGAWRSRRGGFRGVRPTGCTADRGGAAARVRGHMRGRGRWLRGRGGAGGRCRGGAGAAWV